MQRLEKDGIEWLEFDLLADIPVLKHGVLLRRGGYSKGPFKSLNVSVDVGDDAEHVQANLAHIQKTLFPEIARTVFAKQCHGVSIACIDGHSYNEWIGYDALMTSTPNISLLIKHADCQAAIIYDPQHHVVANVHAGWRGQVQNIYAEAIQQLGRVYGSKPADLLVCISPSLGPDDAEFIHFHHELPEEFWGFQVKPTYFDLWAIAEVQLQSAGILPHHIEIARVSTYSNHLDYFSHRRDRLTGRHGTFVNLL